MLLWLLLLSTAMVSRPTLPSRTPPLVVRGVRQALPPTVDAAAAPHPRSDPYAIPLRNALPLLPSPVPASSLRRPLTTPCPPGLPTSPSPCPPPLNPQGLVVQLQAAKLGVVTGKHLAQHCRCG